MLASHEDWRSRPPLKFNSFVLLCPLSLTTAVCVTRLAVDHQMSPMMIQPTSTHIKLLRNRLLFCLPRGMHRTKTHSALVSSRLLSAWLRDLHSTSRTISARFTTSLTISALDSATVVSRTVMSCRIVVKSGLRSPRDDVMRTDDVMSQKVFDRCIDIVLRLLPGHVGCFVPSFVFISGTRIIS